MDPAIERRVIVVGLIHNGRGEWLLCKMPAERGVFPGQWGLPGGGIEPGSRPKMPCAASCAKRSGWK